MPCLVSSKFIHYKQKIVHIYVKKSMHIVSIQIILFTLSKYPVLATLPICIEALHNKNE